MLKQRQAMHLNMLASYSKRLHAVVDGLLAKADAIDQEQKYLPQALDADASRRLGKSCNELVVLAESLKLIDAQIEAGDVRGGRDTLLRCCRVAHHVSGELKTIKGLLITKDS